MKSAVTFCTLSTLPSGSRTWVDRDGRLAAVERPGERAEDVRPSPPFTQILPCPYCGVTADRDHDPLAHVDRRFGRSIA